MYTQVCFCVQYLHYVSYVMMLCVTAYLVYMSVAGVTYMALGLHVLPKQGKHSLICYGFIYSSLMYGTKNCWVKFSRTALELFLVSTSHLTFDVLRDFWRSRRPFWMTSSGKIIARHHLTSGLVSGLCETWCPVPGPLSPRVIEGTRV